MSIRTAIETIEAGTQNVPSNPLANTGLGDLVYWHEVLEWLKGVEA